MPFRYAPFCIITQREMANNLREAPRHTIAGLLGVLVFTIGRDRGKQMLNQLSVGIIAKFDAGTFKNTASAFNLQSQG